MIKQCRYCGFKNPPDIGDCLYCHRSLPTTVGQVKETLRNIDDISQGNLGQVSQRVGKSLLTNQASTFKYRFHPVWFLKLKLHGLKKSLISLLWIFLIIIILVIIGLIYKAIGGNL